MIILCICIIYVMFKQKLSWEILFIADVDDIAKFRQHQTAKISASVINLS